MISSLRAGQGQCIDTGVWNYIFFRPFGKRKYLFHTALTADIIHRVYFAPVFQISALFQDISFAVPVSLFPGQIHRSGSAVGNIIVFRIQLQIYPLCIKYHVPCRSDGITCSSCRKCKILIQVPAAKGDTFLFRQSFTIEKGGAVPGESRVIPCAVSSADGRNNYTPKPLFEEEADRVVGRLLELSGQMEYGLEEAQYLKSAETLP